MRFKNIFEVSRIIDSKVFAEIKGAAKRKKNNSLPFLAVCIMFMPEKVVAVFVNEVVAKTN